MLAVPWSATHLQVRRYAAELVCVLHHLHDNGVVYVDLKPENVLLQDCGHIMLCDMDLVHTQTEIEHLRELEAGEQQKECEQQWGLLEREERQLLLPEHCVNIHHQRY